MRLILFKYITKEIFSFFIVGLFVFIFIIMATRLIWMTDLLVNQNVNPGQLMHITLCMLPRVIMFSMPAVCLMSVLLSFMRLSSDNEIIALNASGISLYQIMKPVIFFSIVNYIIAGLITIYWEPWGNRSYRDVVFGIVKSRADVAIKEKVFYEPFDDIVFYINGISPRDGVMKDIFVVDRRDERVTATIIAEKANIFQSEESTVLTIRFTEGTIFENESDLKRARYSSFETTDLNIDLKDIMSSMVSREIEPREMYIGELVDNLRKSQGGDIERNLAEVRLFEMLSIPLAVFLLGLIGAPLGAYVRGGGYTKGIILSLFIFMAYYISMTGVRYLCETGVVPPFIGVWIPVFFLLIVCAFLMLQEASYYPLGILSKQAADRTRGLEQNP
jgi:lipopolysaccharide export system permease protein